MFKFLDARKMSSSDQTAHVFSYPGANAQLMKTKLTRDKNFLSLNSKNVSKIFLLSGTNNIDSIYYGSKHLCTAKEDLSNLVDYIMNMFPYSTLNIINILPRAIKGRNDVIHELNLHLKELSEKSDSICYVDTESDFNLFSTNSGRRHQQYFCKGTQQHPDNCHLSKPGIVRFARHLKHLAHRKC